MTTRVLSAGCVSLLAALSLLALNTGAVAARTPPEAAELFVAGNRLYQDSDFAGAVVAYEEVLARGYTAPEVEYNLANALLKEGRLGEAILHYRRALLLKPTYENALQNIDYARSLTQDMRPEAGSSDRWSWVGRLRLPASTAAMLLFATITAFLVVAALRLRWWRGLTWATVLQGALGGAALLVAAALLFEWTQSAGREEGVVVVSGIEVRSGPGESYTIAFELHEGTEVEILRVRSGWREIRVSDRLSGWAPKSAVAKI